MLLKVGRAQPEVIQKSRRYFRTSNQNFPGSLVSRPLVRGNEDPGHEIDHVAIASVYKRLSRPA